MAKFKVNYTETYTKTFIVEADSPEEAEEKMEYAAENIPLGDMDNCFDRWEVGIATMATEIEMDLYDPLPEEE